MRVRPTREGAVWAIRRSGDPAIRRSGDPAIRRSGDPAIRRSGDPAIRRSGDPAIRRSGDPAIRRTWRRTGLSRPRAGDSGSCAGCETGSGQSPQASRRQRHDGRMDRVPRWLVEHPARLWKAATSRVRARRHGACRLRDPACRNHSLLPTRSLAWRFRS